MLLRLSSNLRNDDFLKFCISFRIDKIVKTQIMAIKAKIILQIRLFCMRFQTQIGQSLLIEFRDNILLNV